MLFYLEDFYSKYSSYFRVDPKSQLFGLRRVLKVCFCPWLTLWVTLQVTLMEGFVQPVHMEDNIHTFLPVCEHW